MSRFQQINKQLQEREMPPVPKAKDEAKDEVSEAAKVEQESKREAQAKAKAEAEEKARAARIKSGDLIVTGTHEFEAGTKDTKSSGYVRAIIERLKASKEPLVFSQVVSEVGAKYPEDLLVAMNALEINGQVKRFNAKATSGESQRRTVAFLWTGK